MLLRSAAIIFLLSTLVPCLQSQTTSAPLPTDARTLLDLVRVKNGLFGPDVRPWHIHGTYKTYNEKGGVMQEGTYEEWWLAPEKYKRSFASSIFTQTDYADGERLFRDGFQGWWAGFELMLREQLINPIPPASLLTDMQFQNRALSVGQSALQCVYMAYPLRPSLAVGSDPFPTVCVESTIPAIRLNSLGNSRQTTFDNVILFQGHYLAKQIQFLSSGILRAELNLDLVESLNNPSDSILARPPSSKEVDLSSITFLQSSFQYFPSVLRKAVPEYPDDAKSRHIQGVVAIHALVGADGHVEKIGGIKGAFELRSAAQNAVKQWVYRPPEIMGKPRAFAADINVIFTLNRGNGF